MNYTANKKGFTLIELLIVIGILAVLATVTVLVLNPAELFKQARDSQRLADLDTIRDAIIYTQSTAATSPTMVAGPFTTGQLACNTMGIYSNACTLPGAGVIRLVNGTGWVGIDFTGVTPNAITQLPMDPSNVTGALANYYYTYKGVVANGTFKLGAVLESTKYGSTTDADGTDGGTAAGMYEIGTVMTAI